MSRRFGLRAAMIFVLASSVSAGCGGVSDDPTVEGPHGTVDCRDVVNLEVLSAFGWQDQPPLTDVSAEDDACVWSRSSLGELTAYVVGGSGTAQERYDAACARVAELGPLDEDLEADIAGGGTACVVGLDPDVQRGTAEMVLLTPENVVLDIRVEASALLDPERQRSGMRELLRHAQQAFVR